MKITGINISNFRGIRKATIRIGSGTPGRVTTIIGLNESGKTTLLEAISKFASLDPETQNMVETVHSRDDPKTFIPKDRRGRFSDTISITADIVLSDADVETVAKEILKDGLKLDASSLRRKIAVEKRFTFQDSKLIEVRNYWTTGVFRWRKGQSPKWHNHTPGKATPDWEIVVKAILRHVPRIIYFPTFLFELPNRIYLSETPGEDVKNSYYRKIVANILKAVDGSYSIEKHLLNRVADIVKSGDIGKLSNSDETADIDAVIRDISNEISRVIMGAWHEILGKEKSRQRIEMSWGVDVAQDNAMYVELYLISGQHKYLLRERSLGFRWFFSFLLFTQFRRLDDDGRATIFLFDEPASNLHSAAQTALLSSFDKIMGPDDYLIYSTHSHYMINPLWLERAYIVENKAIDLLSDDSAAYEPVPNDVVFIPYPRFVSEHPTRTTYFQPVLDALNYKLSPMILDGPAVILEGKFDYYPFRYLLGRSAATRALKSYSANGAGEMGVLISLFRANDIPFVVVLDDDKQGRAEKARYQRDYHIADRQIITLGDADPALAGLAFEGVFQDDVRALITAHGLDAAGAFKAQGSALFQLLIANGDVDAAVPDTLAVFATLLAKVEACIAEQAAAR